MPQALKYNLLNTINRVISKASNAVIQVNYLTGDSILPSLSDKTPI